MSDDLIKRLGSSCYLAFEDGTNDYSAAQEAIDRIEKLENSLAWYQMMDAMSSDHVVELTDKLEAAEAKLDKVVEALRKIADYTHIGDQGVTQHAEARIARAALAKLEGGEEATGTAWRGRE